MAGQNPPSGGTLRGDQVEGRDDPGGKVLSAQRMLRVSAFGFVPFAATGGSKERSFAANAWNTKAAVERVPVDFLSGRQ